MVKSGDIWSMVNGKFCMQSTVLTFAAAKCHHQGRRVSCREEGGGSLPLSPRLRPSALSGVNCTACVSPLRGLELVSVSVSPTLTCGVIKMSPLRGLAHRDFCPDAACGGKADGWGVRACAVALTVGFFCSFSPSHLLSLKSPISNNS